MAKQMSRKVKLTKLLMVLFLVLVLGGLSLGYYFTKGQEVKTFVQHLTPAEAEASLSQEKEAEHDNAQLDQNPNALLTPSVKKPKLPKKDPSGKPVLISPAGEEWALTLVNRYYALPPSYLPELMPAIEGGEVQLDSRIVPQFRAMYAAAKEDGLLLIPNSGHRSYARQKENYERKVSFFMTQGLSEAQAKQKTEETILPAGCSEHNLGLALDFGKSSAEFATSKEYAWLVTNAADYGFILRYPEGKEAITGTRFLPYHWRYVGVDAAKEMQNANLTLEEYIEAD